MAETLTRTIRVTSEQWARIEKIAGEREVSANRLVVSSWRPLPTLGGRAWVYRARPWGPDVVLE